LSQPFAAKLDLILKALSATRARLAADLRVDKSIVGRWLTGAVHPSPHSLSKITAWVSARVEGFSTLDWDRSLESIAGMLGVPTDGGPEAGAAAPGLPLPLMPEILQTTARRGAAYEGFYRSTRPYASRPGRYLHDYLMLRRDERGLLRFDMASGGVRVEGFALLLQNQLFIVASELTSGSMGFGILNGVNTLQAGVIDGVLVNCALDAGRTPTAVLVIYERIANLAGEPGIDDQTLADLGRLDALAPEGSIPDDIQRHLSRDVGPAQLALGGDWLLRLPMSRSMARGLTAA
jgi:hypothetical protein